jgi:hypothetical protein
VFGAIGCGKTLAQQNARVPGLPGDPRLETYHVDEAVAREVLRLIEERVPGTRPNVDVNGGLIVVTWSGAPYEDIRPLHLDGESFQHTPLCLRKTR